ncbi:pyruvate formate lyase family protein, partial [Thermodesulfobacteriota bacterium]
MGIKDQRYSQNIDNIDFINNRIETLRSSYYESKVRICPERSRLATESWKVTEGQTLHIRRAKLFEKICNEIPIAIFENELIVGSQTSFPRGVGLQLDFSPRIGLQIEEGSRELRAGQAKGLLSNEALETIIEDTNYWKDKSPGDVLL